ncbi:hypothetical protein DASC09_029180 [Saccharomycopsis crataegensis]|uniref:Altered inheritance of mitochondria protein 24, mitochondrial n=1 Tax=Saccharomycopsis crataegensis TaxID=43959 RepID=A0AAV5QN63_9ASCO|nr:hypothetical protein DASC09_029180 [Saccharomycopsis crataegensis]
MAPSTSFLKISDRSAIPIRAFINRRAIAQQLTPENPAFFQTVVSVSNNSKSIVRLHRATKLRLSRIDLSRITTTFRDSLVDILFHIDVEELESISLINSKAKDGKFVLDDWDHHSTKESSSEKIPLNVSRSKDNIVLGLAKAGWRIHLVIDKTQLEILRTGTSVNSKGFNYGNYMRLMMKTADFTFPVEQEENPEAVGIFLAEENKKVEGILKYKKMQIIGKGIDVYVLRRP